jgi:hypothetical protein
MGWDERTLKTLCMVVSDVGADEPADGVVIFPQYHPLLR